MTNSSKASLRILGDLDLETLSQEIGFSPSYSHKRGDLGQIGTTFDSDLWMLSAPLDCSLPLNQHLEWLVQQLEPRYSILEKVRTAARIDVFCRVTLSEQGGISLSPKAMSIFHYLQINLEVSLILQSE